MRIRNESLTTGDLLTHYDSEDRRKNRSILFLISGTRDIQPLLTVEEVCREHIRKRNLPGYEWHSIPNQGLISGVDPFLDASRITRLEACEFAGIPKKDISRILCPVLDRLFLDDRELFPSAGGAVGGPAEGIQFLDREEDLQRLTALIKEKKNIKLLAPRRSGKTSLLLKLRKELQKVLACVHVNFERFHSPEEVAAKFQELATGEGFRSALTYVQKIRWEDALVQSLKRLKGDEERPLLLLVDELVHLCQILAGSGRKQAKSKVLRTLKGFSDAFTGAGAQVVIAGSWNLWDYLQDHVGIPTSDLPELFKDMVPFPLVPLQLDNAKIELKRILLGTGLVPEGNDMEWAERELDLSIPYPALHFIDRLAARIRSNRILTSDEMERELNHYVATTDSFLEFQAHLQRIGEKWPGATEAAYAALSAIADTPYESGALVEDVSRSMGPFPDKNKERLFRWLQETLPVSAEGESIIFRSRIFYRWWKHQTMLGGE